MSLSDTLTKSKQRKQREAGLHSLLEGMGAFRGDPGETGTPGAEGKPGKTPTDRELIALIKPLIPPPLKGDKGDQGTMPTVQEIITALRPLIPNPKDGKTPSKAELIALITPLIPRIKNGNPGKDGSPDTPEQIKEKLKELPIKEQWFDARHIKNLPEDNRGRGRIVKGGGVNLMAYTITSLDGVTKSFSIPANNGIYLVLGTAATFIFNPTEDYTGEGTTTLTFTANVDAPSALAAGQRIRILYAQ